MSSKQIHHPSFGQGSVLVDNGATPVSYTHLDVYKRQDGHSVPKERLLADGSVNALEVYLCRLRRRLEVAGLNIRTVRGFGYRLEVASEVADKTWQTASTQ